MFGFVRATSFCLGSSEKKLKARVPLMPSHVFKYFFFIIRWPQFGVLHDPLSSLYTGVSARILNPWVSFCPPIDFLNHQMVILGHASHNTKTHIGSISYDIHTIYSKKGLLTPLTKDSKSWKVAAARHLGIPRASIVLSPNPQQFRVCTTN